MLNIPKLLPLLSPPRQTIINPNFLIGGIIFTVCKLQLAGCNWWSFGIAIAKGNHATEPCRFILIVLRYLKEDENGNDGGKD